MIKVASIILLCAAVFSGLTLAGLTINNGTKAVTTSGTPVPLAASQTNAAWVTVQALSSNTGTICMGGSTVRASSKNGTCFTAGESAPLFAIPGVPYNLAAIYIDATVSGEGVSFTYAF